MNQVSTNIQEQEAHKNRIRWIDALRGFTMFLVVFGHVLFFSFDTQTDTIAASFFVTFRMPMFFFISGFIGYKAIDRWSARFYAQNLRKKLLVQTVPAFFFYTLFQLSHNSSALAFLNDGFGGYWFTFVLLEMFVIYFTVSLIAHHSKDFMLDLLLISIAIFFQVLSITAFQDTALWRIFSLYNLTFYFIFFAMGVLFRRHLPMVTSWLDKRYTQAAIIISFISLFYIHHSQPFAVPPHLSYAVYLSCKILALLMIFNFFRFKKDYFNQDNALSKTMIYVGHRTLDIYLIHFFFLPDLSEYGERLLPSSMVLFQIIIPALIAAGIIALCLLCSELIRSSNVLAHYILGVKRQ